MMISESMNRRLNEQIGHEFGASHAYLATSCAFATHGLKVLAAKFRKQAEEERGHALKIADYVVETGGRVELTAIPAPQGAFPTVAAAIEAALEQERRVTKQIHDLVKRADEELDYATRSFLQWFVDEQVEEVSSMTALLEVAKLANGDLLKLEMYLAQVGEDDED